MVWGSQFVAGSFYTNPEKCVKITAQCMENKCAESYEDKDMSYCTGFYGSSDDGSDSAAKPAPAPAPAPVPPASGGGVSAAE